MTEVDYRPNGIDVSEDYGDTWRLLVKPGALSGRVFAGWFSQSTNPLTDPAKTPLDIVPHESESGWFYVGQDAATTSGWFRVVTTDGEPVTVLVGTLSVS